MYNTVECPYCKYDNKVTSDHHEGNSEFDMECNNCGKEFEVSVEYNPIYNSSKIEYIKCDKCESLNREIRKRGYSFPFPKNEQYNTLCHHCYCIEYFKEQEQERI